MEILSNCPLCNGTEFTDFLICKDHLVSNENFHIVECNSCRLKYTNPRPKPEELGKYYESEEYVSHTGSKKGLINNIYHLVRKYTLIKKLQLVNSLTKGRSILDIGCGTGEFLSICKEGGWQTTGIEPNQNAREHGISQYGIDVKPENGISELEDHSFDVITMWHVLEHVPDLQGRVTDLKRLLKKGGRVVIAVPNCTSKDAQIYKEYWAAYDVPRHLYHFTPDTIRKLFRQFNLNVESILPMTFDSFYVSMLSEKYKSGSILKAFWNGLRSNISAIKTRETYSSQIYILKSSEL